MKVFVGWPYEATWVEEYAIPLIKTYGVDVVTGKELEGQKLTDAIKAFIEEADAAIFFTTRRKEDLINKTWQTSDWVVDEIKHADSQKKEHILEFREEGVDYPNKLHDERQYKLFKSEDRLRCFVDLGKAINNWRGLSIKLKLLPEDFIKTIRPRLLYEKYSCTYSIRRRGKVIHGPVKAKIVPEEKAWLVMYANDLPADFFDWADAFIEVEVDIGDRWWASGISLSSLEVSLEKF